MSWSYAVLLILGVLTLGARGDEDTINSVADDEAVNSTPSQPPSAPVLVLLLNLLSNDTLGNGTTPGESQGNSSDIPEPRAVLLISTLVAPAANGTEDGSNTTALEGSPLKIMTEEPQTSTPRLEASDASLIRRKRTLKSKGCGILCGLLKMKHQPMHQPTCNTCNQPPVYVYQPQPVHPQPQPVHQQPMYCDVCGRPHPRPQPHYQQPQPHYQQPQPHYQQPQPHYQNPCTRCGGGGGGNDWTFSQSNSQASSSSSSYSQGKKK